MGTTAYIGIAKKDYVRFVSIYSDGYVSYTGRILHEAYQDEVKVNQLIELGEISIIGPEIGEKHDFGKHGDEHRNWVLAYHRDREEEFLEPDELDEEQFWKLDGVCYLYKNGRWWTAANESLADRLRNPRKNDD